MNQEFENSREMSVEMAPSGGQAHSPDLAAVNSEERPQPFLSFQTDADDEELKELEDESSVSSSSQPSEASRGKPSAVFQREPDFTPQNIQEPSTLGGFLKLIKRQLTAIKEQRSSPSRESEENNPVTKNNAFGRMNLLVQAIRSKLVDPMLNDLTRKKYEDIAEKQTSDFLNSFGDQYPEIRSLIKLERGNNAFAAIWTKCLLVVFAYNFLTCFWMLAFPSFPKGAWFFFEMTTEVITLADFFIKLILKKYFQTSWKGMTILHDKLSASVVGAFASFPYSITFAAIFHNRPAALTHFAIACTRMLKLVHFRGFTAYFESSHRDPEKAAMFSIAGTVFNFLMFLHVVCTIFVIPERFQDHHGWFEVAGYYKYDVPNWQKYLDSMGYGVSNMSGMGWGNIVPTANAEWFASCIVFTLGCTLYLKLQSDLTYQISARNQKFMENLQNLEQFKILAEMRNLPVELREKIRYYFKHLRIPFEDLRSKLSIIDGLPVSLKGEIASNIHSELLKSIEIFQDSSPQFISKFAAFLTPQISILNEYVIPKDILATRMYFIHEGVCEVQASDDSVIQYLTKGDFFGEVCCLMTNILTNSVVARTTTLLYQIKRADLLSVLEEFPRELQKLKDIALQRQRSTSCVTDSQNDEIRKIDIIVQRLELSTTIFGKTHSGIDEDSTIPDIKSEFLQNLQTLNRSFFFRQKSLAPQIVVRNKRMSMSDIHAVRPLELTKNTHKQRLQIWQTVDFTPDYFIIVPFSVLFHAWNAILFLAVAHDCFMIPFQIAFSYQIQGPFLAADIFCQCLSIVDIAMRANTAITSPNKYQFERQKVCSHYFNSWFLLDAFAAFPYCYCLLIAPETSFMVMALAKLPRLLKLRRIVEIFQILECNLDVRIEIFRIIELFLLFGLSGHLWSCAWGFLGAIEYTRSNRFDGKTMFAYMKSVPQQTGIITDIENLTSWQLYALMMYLGFGVQGCCPYGDQIPFAPSEQILGIVNQIWARVLIVVINSQFFSYFGFLFTAQAKHVSRRDLNYAWMHQNAVSSKFITRYLDYENSIWENLQGMDEEQIIKMLPRSLRFEVQQHIFRVVSKAWNPLKGESQGTIGLLVRKLQLLVYPSQEYIYTAGEIAEDMFFILKGVVEIRNTNGEVIAILKKGESFGEKALTERSNADAIRTKHAFAQTMVSLAVLTRKNFEKVCGQSPTLLAKVEEFLLSRKQKILLAENKILFNFDAFHVSSHFSSPMATPKGSPVNSPKASQRSSMNQSRINLIRPSGTRVTFPIGSIRNDQESHLVNTLERRITSSLNDFQIKIESNREIAQQLAGALPPKLTKSHKSEFSQTKSISHYFDQLEQTEQKEHSSDYFRRVKQVNQFFVQVMGFYNLAFIPIQFAFRLPFSNTILALELFTVLMYLTEVILRIRKIRMLQALPLMPISQVEGWKMRRLHADSELLKQEINQQRLKVIITSTALLPISLIISLSKHYEPFGLILWFQSLRLIKIRPVVKFWRWAKRINLNAGTFFQAVFYYILAAHWLACVMVGLAIFKEDHRDSWLRRLPAPSTPGVRSTPNVFDDLTFIQVFNYAFYFEVNTLSNLTIGDVTAITLKEKVLVGINVWIGTFIYNCLYATITMVVQFIASGRHIEFLQHSMGILSKLKESNISNPVIQQAQGFFTYVTDRHLGVNFDHVLKSLPGSMGSDLAMSLFHQAIEQSLLFRNEEGEINLPLAISTLKQLKFRTFMASEFIVKVGQLTNETLILLEGELRFYGINDNELLGILTKGSHFGLDLSDDFTDRKIIKKYDDRVKTRFKMDFASDNFEDRSIVSIAANSLVTVGILKPKERERLYSAFPQFKQRMQFMNRILFMMGKVSLERLCEKSLSVLSRQDCLNLQLSNIYQSTQQSYHSIIDSNLEHPNNGFDVSAFMAKLTISASKDLKECADSLKDIVNSHLLNLNYNSQGLLIQIQQSKFAIMKNSSFAKTMKIVQFVNILYVAFIIPFQISFSIDMNRWAVAAEVLSLLVSAVFFGMHLLNPVVTKEGKQQVNPRLALKQYWKEGLIIDAFGLLPLNLILGIVHFKHSLAFSVIITLSILRLSRAFCILRGLTLIDELEVYLKGANYYVILIKAVTIWFTIAHLMSCSWFYLNNVIERDYKETWALQQKLQDKSTAEKYLRAFYFTLNVAPGIGTGDMIPQNELERLSISLFMICGDVVMSFGFGLMIYFFGLSRNTNPKGEMEAKVRQVLQIQQSDFIFDTGSKMEKYFAVQHYQSQTTYMLTKQELKKDLPSTIVQEVIVQTNAQVITILFQKIKSENLIRELCLALTCAIYLPGDAIISYGEIAETIYFVEDGSAHLFSADKLHIITTLSFGEVCGEIEVLEGTKRVTTVTAATYCTLKALSRDKMLKIAKLYPQMLQILQTSANDKIALLEEHATKTQSEKSPKMAVQKGLTEEFTVLLPILNSNNH